MSMKKQYVIDSAGQGPQRMSRSGDPIAQLISD